MTSGSSSSSRLGSGLRQLIPTGHSDLDVVVAVEQVAVSRVLVDVAAALLSNVARGAAGDPSLQELAATVAGALRATTEIQGGKFSDV